MPWKCNNILGVGSEDSLFIIFIIIAFTLHFPVLRGGK